MNVFGRKKSKDSSTKKENSIFTKETWGVILVLFTTIISVCLITGELIFSLPGKYVREFMLGSFGFFAYAVAIGLFVVGIELITGKSLPFEKNKKALAITGLCLIAVLGQLIFMNGKANSYGEYLNIAYNTAFGEEYFCSFSGLFFSIISFPIQALLTVLGGSIIVGIILAFVIVCFVKAVMTGEKTEHQKFRNTYIDIANTNQDNNTVNNQSYHELEFNTNSTEQHIDRTNKTQTLFINNEADFHSLSKRDIVRENAPEIKLAFTDGGLGVAKANNTYVDSYTEEMKRKIEYIKTPVRLNVEKDRNANSYYSTTTISEPIPKEKPDSREVFNNILKPEIKKEPSISNIPLFEHNDEKEQPILKDDSAEKNAQDYISKYAYMEETDGISTEPNDVFRPLEVKPEEKERANPLKDIPFITPKREDFEFDNGEIEEVLSQTPNEEVVEEPIKEEKDEVKPSNIFSYRSDFSFDDIDDSKDNLDEKESEEIQSSSTTNEVELEEGIEEIVKLTESEKVKEEEPLFRVENLVKPKAQEERKAQSIIVEEKKEEKKVVPINRVYNKPPLDLLDSYESNFDENTEHHQERMEIIKQTLEDFHVNAEPKSYIQGPAITRYEIMMPAGVSVKKVLGFDDDLKMRLASYDGVRIEAPIPGKNLVGIEVANKTRIKVGLKELLMKTADKPLKAGSLNFAIGKDIVGNAITDNLSKGPHYLVAGATGSGKSVCLNVMIISLIMRYSPEELRLILVDPKSVGFRIYQHLPHLMIDEIITEPKRALTALAWAQDEMEKRYRTFNECTELITDIDAYNQKISGPKVAKMPRIVIIIDELADLMETCKKDMETRIRMIAQKARAAGIHLVLATQRPSVDIITGTIKANLPSRIALKVMNFADSSTILSQGGAEKLLGNGDMLYKNSSMADVERYQGAFLSDDEITRVVNYINANNQAYFDDELSEYLDKATKVQEEENEQLEMDGIDNQNEVNEFFLKALWLAVNSGTVSVSMLQRRFQIGYARAGGLVDKMERMGFITGSEGSKPRSVLLTKEGYMERFGNGPDIV